MSLFLQHVDNCDSNVDWVKDSLFLEDTSLTNKTKEK